MKNKIFNLIVVLLLIVSMVCGCSSTGNKIIVSTDNVENNTIVNNNSTEQVNANQNALDSKLVELYLSTKETQAYNKEHNIFGEYDAKFDSTGRLWIKKVDSGDTIRETHEMFINYTYTIYENINSSTYYTKKVGSDMNTNMVLEINYLKNGYDLTQEEYEKIQNEFDSMEDYYNLLTNINKSYNKIIENGKEQNGRRINRELSKNNYKIINLFKNDKCQFNQELNELYLETKDKQNSNAKIDINGFLWVNEFDDNKETYRVYVDEDFYNEYTCAKTNNVNSRYIGKVNYNANDTYETEWDKEIFERVKSTFNTILDRYDNFVNGGVINDIPKIEKVTTVNRGNEIRNNIDSLKDRNLSREEEFIRFTKLNNIFSKVCSNDKKVDWTYLELSDNFRNKYETKQDKSILNCFNFKANYFPYFEVINDNIVTFMAHNEYNIALEGCDYRFYITFTYDNIGNIDDIIDIKVLTEFAPEDAPFNYINGSSEYGLKLLSGYIDYSDSGIYNYSQTYTSDKFWKSYKPDKGILNINVSNVFDNNYGDENYSDRIIKISKYDNNKKYCSIYVKMDDGSEHNFLIKWKTIEYDLLDDIEVIDLNATREYKEGKFYINGNEQNNNWVYYDGYWYYCDKDGNIVTNKWIDGKYLDLDGKKIVSGKTPDGKYVDEMGYVIDDLSYDLVSSAREKDILSDAWYKTRSGLWYYFENDRTTTKKGWFTDSQDNQTYYLEPGTGIMQVGYVNIDGDTYYFNESTDNEPNWYEVGDGIYESYGKKVKAYGSMFRDEETPDGKRVDADGKVIKDEKEN